MDRGRVARVTAASSLIYLSRIVLAPWNVSLVSVVPGAAHLATQRGNRREGVFFGDEDEARLLISGTSTRRNPVHG